jgi:hypothetical protein
VLAVSVSILFLFARAQCGNRKKEEAPSASLPRKLLRGFFSLMALYFV